METCEHCTTILGALALIIPIVVKTAHALGYSLPFLSALADWIANRPEQPR